MVVRIKISRSQLRRPLPGPASPAGTRAIPARDVHAQHRDQHFRRGQQIPSCRSRPPLCTAFVPPLPSRAQAPSATFFGSAASFVRAVVTLSSSGSAYSFRPSAEVTSKRRSARLTGLRMKERNGTRTTCRKTRPTIIQTQAKPDQPPPSQRPCDPFSSSLHSPFPLLRPVISIETPAKMLRQRQITHVKPYQAYPKPVTSPQLKQK